MANESNAFTDDIFNDLFNDIGSSDGSGFENLFADAKPEEPKEKAPETPKAEEPEAPAEPVKEEAAPEPPAEEVKAEPEPEAEATKAEEPVAEEPAKEEAPVEEPKAEVTEDVKEEVDDAAEESESADDTSAETDAAPEEAVEADAPAAEKAEAAEPAEPVVEEVKVEKKHRRRRSKKAKAAEAKAEEAETKVEEPKAEEKAGDDIPDLPDPSAPINENIIKNFVLTLGPIYEEFRAEVGKRINNIVVQPDMAPAVIQDMISKNNDLDKLLFYKGQGYFDAYTNLTASKTGLIDRTRKHAEMTTKGDTKAKRLAADLAIMNYTVPATGERINLLQYANALKQAMGFVTNAKDYVKSTSIVLNTMLKAAA